MKKRSNLPAYAFLLATIGGVVIPVSGSLAAIVLGSIARKAASPSDLQAYSFASLSILLGWGGLARWVLLLATRFFGNRH
jgi:hypothetical protein